jgi:HAT1-interacting factor 1
MGYSESVSKLIADGSRAYSAKEYDDASEKYAEACETFVEEHSEDDADLLLLYGKALFQSAVSKSEVFGGTKSSDVEKNEEKEEEKEDAGNFQFYDAAPVAGEEEIEQEEDGEKNEESEDEKNDESEEEKNDEQEEEQSDFEVAWEILDLARALFETKLEESENKSTPPYLKSDTDETEDEFIILTKKLSETYDLLGEVSLEAENFPQSADDLQKCLDIRLKLYNPQNSSLISESHYKLSLALEFCVEDPKLRQKAAEQMKLAIESVKARNAKETNPQKKKDNDELIQDLVIRYQELKKDPIEELESEQLDIIKGILGEPSSSGNASAGIVGAINDLSSAVKRKPAVNDLTSSVKKRKGPKGASTKK